jgi:hypothetical protein
MSLQVVSRVGPYEILSAVGAGWMGEVYRVRDTKLARRRDQGIAAQYGQDPDCHRTTRVDLGAFRAVSNTCKDLGRLPKTVRFHGWIVTRADAFQRLSDEALAKLRWFEKPRKMAPDDRLSCGT